MRLSPLIAKVFMYSHIHFIAYHIEDYCVFTYESVFCVDVSVRLKGKWNGREWCSSLCFVIFEVFYLVLLAQNYIYIYVNSCDTSTRRKTKTHPTRKLSALRHEHLMNEYKSLLTISSRTAVSRCRRSRRRTLATCWKMFKYLLLPQTHNIVLAFVVVLCYLSLILYASA